MQVCQSSETATLVIQPVILHPISVVRCERLSPGYSQTHTLSNTNGRFPSHDQPRSVNSNINTWLQTCVACQSSSPNLPSSQTCLEVTNPTCTPFSLLTLHRVPILAWLIMIAQCYFEVLIAAFSCQRWLAVIRERVASLSL